jgi:predicted nucleic acid-binding protein
MNQLIEICQDFTEWPNSWMGAEQDLEYGKHLPNDLILTELIPDLKARREEKIIPLLYQINRLPLAIHWKEQIEFQVKCLKNGVNGVGIPDLIIAQNALQNRWVLYSFNTHFNKLKEILGLPLIS